MEKGRLEGESWVTRIGLLSGAKAEDPSAEDTYSGLGRVKVKKLLPKQTHLVTRGS